MTEPVDLTEKEHECPKCKKKARQLFVRAVEAVMHIPDRYIVVCPDTECATVWYLVADKDAENRAPDPA